jgi:hypothetical protein
MTGEPLRNEGRRGRPDFNSTDMPADLFRTTIGEMKYCDSAGAFAWNLAVTARLSCAGWRSRSSGARAFVLRMAASNLAAARSGSDALLLALKVITHV